MSTRVRLIVSCEEPEAVAVVVAAFVAPQPLFAVPTTDHHQNPEP